MAQSHVVGRRCEAVRENGERCRGIPVLGETYCHAHRRFREASGRVTLTIPLMDDEASITFVRSQTVRALALGSIPPANGRVMLEGCRDEERRLDRRLAAQNAALRYAALADRMGAEKLDALMGRFLQSSEHRAPGADGRSAVSDQRSETGGERSESHEPTLAELKEKWHRILEETAEKDARAGAAWDGTRSQEAGDGEQKPVISDEEGNRESVVGDQRPVISDQRSVSSGDELPVAGGQQPEEQATGNRDQRPSGAPEREPVMHRSVFPAVKEQWDRALARTEGKMTEMVAPQEGESWYDFLARKKERETAIAAV